MRRHRRPPIHRNTRGETSALRRPAKPAARTPVCLAEPSRVPSGDLLHSVELAGTECRGSPRPRETNVGVRTWRDNTRLEPRMTSIDSTPPWVLLALFHSAPIE